MSASLGYQDDEMPGVALGDAGTSCAIDTSGCVDLGTIALTPVTLGCLTGTATLELTGGTSSVPITGNVPIWQSVGLSGAQLEVGYSSYINLGVIPTDDAGSFCTSFVPGTSVIAGFPGNPGCSLKYGGVSDLDFPDDAGAGAACGSSACVTGGDIFFGCS